MNNRRRIFPFPSTAPLFVAVFLGAATLPAFATNTVSQINSSIKNLSNQRATHQKNARSAHQQAAAYGSQAETLHVKLKKAQILLQRATAVHNNYLRQIKRTEAQIVETRHRRQIVTKRYNRHLGSLQQRLSATQRTSPLGYMEILLGARSFSDLSRRIYLFNAILEQDATLQQQLKQDKAELAVLHNTLMSQWQQRNELVQATQREKTRIYLAQQQTEMYWKQMKGSQAQQYARAQAELRSSQQISGLISNLSGKRSSLIARYQRQERQRVRQANRPRLPRNRTYRAVNTRTVATSNTRNTSPRPSTRTTNNSSTKISNNNILFPAIPSPVPVASTYDYDDRLVTPSDELGTLSEEFDDGSSYGF